LSLALIAALAGHWDMFLVGWVAYSPDGYWVYLFFKYNHSMRFKFENFFTKFHKKIQFFERPWGIYVELVVAAILMPMYIHYLLV